MFIPSFSSRMQREPPANKRPTLELYRDLRQKKHSVKPLHITYSKANKQITPKQ